MITENGAIKVRTVIDEKMQKEFSANTNKLALAMLIVGAIGTFVFFVLFIISEFVRNMGDGFALPFMIVFAACLGGGIGIKVLLNKVIQQVKGGAKVNEYEFFSDYFTVNQISGGETVATAKFYNTQIIKIKNGKNYFYLYINAQQVFPVDKTELSENELATLKTVFHFV